MNKMVKKRGLLKDFLLGVLSSFGQYRIEERLRMATFQQTSRAERIELMGEDYTYGEILYRPNVTSEGNRSARSTSRNRDHYYEVYLWLKFKDHDLYESSSQSQWDELVEGDEGVLKSIENTAQLDGFTLSKPENIQTHEVVMDNSNLELAHFLTFRIKVRG